MFWIGLFIGLFVGAASGAVGMGWLCSGKFERLSGDNAALEEQLATERKRTAAFVGEVRALDTKLYQLNNKPSMGE